MSTDKLTALAQYLECDANELHVSTFDESVIEHGSAEYLVLTDDEADERCKEQIMQSLWAFNASFIASHSKSAWSDSCVKAFEKMQGKLCEDANPLIEAMIEDMDYFVSDAVSSDGRGHFLSFYDGNENEHGEYFIYRIN